LNLIEEKFELECELRNNYITFLSWNLRQWICRETAMKRDSDGAAWWWCHDGVSWCGLGFEFGFHGGVGFHRTTGVGFSIENEELRTVGWGFRLREWNGGFHGGFRLREWKKGKGFHGHV